MMQIEPKIITVKELLETSGLTIPEYQRPYKWTVKHVNQLIDDILLFQEKSAYRLGTVVLHKDKDTLNIVDGQQRTLTLVLIALAIKEKSKDLEELNSLIIDLNNFPNWNVKNQITKYNIQNNYREIKRRIKDFDKKTILFFFNKCEIVKVVLDDITEAFQFFDSQNARGKDLEPHDLLKAFHLREMSHLSEKEKTNTVKAWEDIPLDTLSRLFSQYLFRIRNWGKGRSARYFTKNDIDLFKGINPDSKQTEPLSIAPHIAHHYIDNYNKDYHRLIDHQLMKYPFQLDQVILNGTRFFEMVNHYEKMINLIRKDDFNSEENIIKILNSYEGRYRTGDKYVRNLFDCALIYYIDKFGEKDISRAIEKIFIWAYTIRLTKHSVQIASVDNHALGAKSFFKIMREATSHTDIINMGLPTIKSSDRTDKPIIKKLKKLFVDLKYLKET